MVVPRFARSWPVCKLCGHSSGEANPLNTPWRRGDVAQRRRPWAKYQKDAYVEVEGEQELLPAGKLCLPCLNTYRGLGAALSVACPMTSLSVCVCLSLSLDSLSRLPQAYTIATAASRNSSRIRCWSQNALKSFAKLWSSIYKGGTTLSFTGGC